MAKDDVDKDGQPMSKARRAANSGALGKVLQSLAGTAAPIGSASPAATDSRSETASRAVFFPSKGPATVPAEVCRPWEFADRPDGEFVHLDDVASSFASEGQLQPAVVRPVNDPAHPDIRYEVIAGQVRWRAAKKAGVPLDILVRQLDDEAAFRVMVSENEYRRGLSDYARAKRLAQALARGLYKDKTSLAQAVGLSSSQLSYFLGFAELDPVVVGRFKQLADVSTRLGYVLNAAVKEGFLSQVLRDLPRIESGEIRREMIPEVWRGEKTEGSRPTRLPAKPRAQSRVYSDSAGRALFSVVQGGKGAAVTIAPDIASELSETFWTELQALVLRHRP